jgi:PAS domain S-box-containing protein
VAVLLLGVTALCLFESCRSYVEDLHGAVEVAILPPGAAASREAPALQAAQAAALHALDQTARGFADSRIGLASCLCLGVLILLGAAWAEACAMERGLGDASAALAAPPGQSRLHRSSEFLEFAQAAGGFGVFELDLVTEEVTGTPLFYELAGVENAASVLSRNDWLLTVLPADLESVIEHLNESITNMTKFQIEYRSPQRSGAIRWLAGAGQVLPGADGLPARVIGSVTDITERKRLESSLRYATESLNLAQAVAGVATMDFDLARQTWFASANYREILGLAEDTRLEDFEAQVAAVHPEDRERVRRARWDTTAEKPAYHCEYRTLRPDGAERWISETATCAHGRDGKLTRITGSLQVITDRKLAEQSATEARLAAEAANRAKSDFLANVSHEIRTPMNGVIGMSQMLAQTPLDDMQREYVEVISGSAKALLSLINDVLDVSKIEAGQLDLESVDFDLRDAMHETVAVMAVQAAAKGIELIVDCTQGPAMLRGDPMRLRQIVMNLVANAVKFTHEGHVEVTASSVRQGDGPPLLRIEVADTGIGIPADRIDRLFRMFSQVDSSTTRYYGGSGLGLSIVKRLAELMGGSVGVRTELGKGSTFWVTLCMQVLDWSPNFPQLGAGKRVLVVDDVRASRDSLERKLRLFGYEVACAASVEEAWRRLDGGAKFDVVAADDVMPGRGGLELLAMLRESPRHAALPFVLLSLCGADHDTEQGRHAPDGVAYKPIRAVKLVNTFTKVLGGERHVPALRSNPITPAARFQGRKILLVEDNAVNQRVAQRMLQSFGAQVVIANNGAEALERIAQGSFDAVLMDCQMPVMDGFMATHSIREAEQAGGARRLPIIALSANVMTEDRERCIAAGMDAHLAKPLDSARLAEYLGRFLTEQPRPAEVDLQALRELTGGDADFEQELVGTFLQSGDQCLADIIEALAKSDLDTIGKRAHSLKGASANIHAHGLSAAASQLEIAARERAVPKVAALVDEVRERLAAVNLSLSKTG